MDNVIQLDTHWLTLLVSTILPIVVGIVTKKFAAGSVKSLVLVGLTILTGGLNSALQADGAVELYPWLEGMIVSFIVAGAIYHNVWKPIGVASAAQNVAPDRGLGKVSA